MPLTPPAESGAEVADPEDGASGASAGRSFAYLGIGEALARGIAFVTMLLLARRLGPAAYGVVGVAAGIMLYLSQIADGGIELVGVPAIARDRAAASTLASATLTYRAAAAIGLTVLVVPLALLVLPRPDGSVLAVYALSLVFTALSARWVYLGIQQPAAVAAARVAGEALGMVIVLVTVRTAEHLHRVPLAALAAIVVSTGWMLLGLGRHGVRLRVLPDWARCKALFAQAKHMLVFTLLGLILFNFDLIFLRFVRGREVAGFYAAAYTVISFGANVIVAYAHSVLPVLTRANDVKAERQAVYGSAMSHAFAVALPAGVGGLLAAHAMVTLVFGRAFLDSVTAMQWLLLTLPISALREIAVVALISASGERQLVRVNAATAAANVALNLALVPLLGIVGAAAATLLTEVVRLVLAARAASRAGFAWPSPGRYLRPLVAVAVMWAVVRLSGAQALGAIILVGIACYGLVLFMTGGITFRRGSLPRLAD